MASPALGSVVLRQLARPFIEYNRLLERNPLVVKSLTSGVMYAAGDALAQLGEHYAAKRQRAADAAAGSAPAEPLAFRFNWRRMGVLWLFGTVVSGPAMHFWFGTLDRLPAALFALRQHRQKLKILRAYATLKRHNIKVELDVDKLPQATRSRPWLDKASKIAADQLIFSSVYTLVFFLSVGMANGAIDKLEADAKAEHIAEVQGLLAARYSKPERQLEADLHRLKSRLASRGRSGGEDAEGSVASVEAVLALLGEEKRKARLTWQDVWHTTWAHTQSVFVPTYIADCVFWPPLQLINFSFVPLRFQVLFVNSANLIWNAYLSTQAHSGSDHHGAPPVAPAATGLDDSGGPL